MPTLPDYNLWMMAPELFLFGWALLVLTYDLGTGRRSSRAVNWLALLGPLLTVVVGFALYRADRYGYGAGFGAMFQNDPSSLFFKLVFLLSAALAVAMSFQITRERIVNHRGEYFGLILLSTVGMMFLASSNELLSLYIGLELTTIPLFVLAAFYKDDKTSVEAGVKYLIIGALSSALLLYGISYVYGLSGSTELLQGRWNIATTHIDRGEIGLILILANVCLLAGLGFKLGLPPFHQWVPDVYEGAPTPVAAFLSVGSKAAGLVAFAKVMMVGLYQFYDRAMEPNDWGVMAGILAAAAMIIGNVMAVRQQNVKRLLGYSSIAQAGYIMTGMLAYNHTGMSALAFYLFVYMFANMGAFAVVALVEDRTGSADMAKYAGLSQSSPFYAAAMSIFLLSLTGIPPLAGFFAKYFVFLAAFKQAQVGELYSWLYWLVGIGLLTSVFALYYYARIIKEMYFSKAAAEFSLELATPVKLVVVCGIIGVLLFGLYPSLLTDFTDKIPPAFGFFLNP